MKKTKLIVLLLALVMLLSAFAPTFGIFAEELHNPVEDSKNDKDTLDYVSIGDSMTNGVGLPGYDETVHEGSTNVGSNGYLEAAPDAYPAQFAEWLEEYTGKKVNLTQLATSAARAEDVWYILNHGTENAFAPDPWTLHELLLNSDRWGHPNGAWIHEDERHVEYNNRVAETYRNAVANADIISYAMGNANFGVFFMGRLMNIVGFGSASDLATDRERYGYMTVENALELCEANEEVTELALNLYADAYDYLVGMELPADLTAEILNYLVYTTASYVVTFMKTMDYIAYVNPDATVMILPLINNCLDFNFDITLHGITKHFNAGDFLGALYTPINAFMAAYTAKLNFTGASDNTYYYAELPVDENGETIQVETFAQAFETLYAPIVDGAYPESRLFCHNRFIGEIREFIFPLLLGSAGVDFDENDVKDYELAKANGTTAFTAYVASNIYKAEWISYYLGIVDAVFTAMQATANVNLDEIEMPEGEFSILSLLGPIVGELGATVYNNIQDNANAISGSLYIDLVEANVVPAVAPYFCDPILVALFDMDTEATDLEKTLYIISLALNNDARFEYAPELQGMKAHLVGAHEQIMAVVPSIAMLTVLPETLSAELTNVGLLEALLALYGRLKLAWGLSVHPSYHGHDTLTQSLVDAYKNEYTTKDETINNIIAFISQYYEVIYELLYNYAHEQGYIDMVVESIDLAIDYAYIAIEEVSKNLPEEATEELKASLIVEFYAIIDTLNEIREVLVTDSAADFNGLLVAIKNLEDDYYRHCNNIAEIYLQIEHINQGHTFTNYVYNNDATCTANGTESAKCDTCSKVYTREALDTAIGHSFTNYVYNNDATCTEGGTETATCDYCDAIDTKVCCSSSYGHDWKDATCTIPKTCERCGEVSGSALGHCYDNACDAICNTCGNERTPSAHIDDDKDGVCDKCGIELGNNKSDPESTSQKQNFFVVIWTYIANFFRFLFGFIFKV